MASSDERIKVLQMIQEGKLSVDEGAQLLDALKAPKSPQPPKSPSMGGRFLRILVTDSISGKAKVNIRVPVGVVNAGAKIGAKFATDVKGFDQEELMEAIDSGRTGLILDVTEEDKHEHVEIFIEE